MILAVDIGNSNIVLGGVREKEILFQARIVTDHIKTSDQYCAELKTMLTAQNAAIEALSKAVGANPGDIAASVEKAVKAKLDALEINVTAK